MRSLISLVAVAALAPFAASQLPDLQTGRNFPTAAAQFGTNRSENIDVGDIDFDGDYDVLVVNGGDGSAQANQLWVNNGGLQGGTIGTFSNQSGTRLAGAPIDTSRDGEFADFDNDADLDIYISNRGTTVNGGEVSRGFINLGGLQGGTVGFYAEYTATGATPDDWFWGDLISVPGSDEEGVADGRGPFRDFTCDCDFADLDDDGDLDLFHSSYGPNINGTRDSRIFLNDGAGHFDELWPWINAGADIQTHTLDMDIADFDDDLDLDIFMSSRDSQARVYRNNLAENGWSTTPYTDITQQALIATGATVSGTSNYEAEFGDLDGDGDFDVWAKNYAGFTDRILRNNGNFTFTIMPTWISGDPNVDENEVDLLDYDSDGDLDAFVANFSGTNSIYQSGLADGMAPPLYARTGTAGSPSPETPSSNNGGTTLDGECADMDNDGDPDILLANDGNQQNRYWVNALGVPDTHAPTFHFRTVQGDKNGPSDTVVHIQVRDNANFYMINYYDAKIVYTLDGGPETNVQMFNQGGQQWRGVIPAMDGTIAYRFEVTDDAGNTGVSPTESYVHTGAGGTPLWQDIGGGTVGENGPPSLTMGGPQVGGQNITLSLVGAGANKLVLLVVAAGSNSPVNLLGGTIHAFPWTDEALLATDGSGTLGGAATWPVGVPSGFKHYWQLLVEDGVNPYGIALTNAVEGTTP